jgi:hypothetical protein
LRSLGVDFQTKEDKWNKMCEEASALYDEKTGEMGPVRTKKLSHWIHDQKKRGSGIRDQKKRKSIPPYQIEKLQNLGILKKDE